MIPSLPRAGRPCASSPRSAAGAGGVACTGEPVQRLTPSRFVAPQPAAGSAYHVREDAGVNPAPVQKVRKTKCISGETQWD